MKVELGVNLENNYQGINSLKGVININDSHIYIFDRWQIIFVYSRRESRISIKILLNGHKLNSFRFSRLGISLFFSEFDLWSIYNIFRLRSKWNEKSKKKFERVFREFSSEKKNILICTDYFSSSIHLQIILNHFKNPVGCWMRNTWWKWFQTFSIYEPFVAFCSSISDDCSGLSK